MLARTLSRLGSRTWILGEVLVLVFAVDRGCGAESSAEGGAAGAQTTTGDTGASGGGGTGGGETTGGEGGATSTAGGGTTTNPTGGTGGETGGGGGTGGTGGACEPNGNTCENAAQGSCAPVDNGCGVLDCAASCGTAPPAGDMTCTPAGECACAPFDVPNPSADAACLNLNGGAARRCIGATPQGVPATCALYAGDTYCCTM